MSKLPASQAIAARQVLKELMKSFTPSFRKPNAGVYVEVEHLF